MKTSKRQRSGSGKFQWWIMCKYGHIGGTCMQTVKSTVSQYGMLGADTKTKPGSWAAVSESLLHRGNLLVYIIGDVSDTRSIIEQPMAGDYWSIVQIAVCHFIFILFCCWPSWKAKQRQPSRLTCKVKLAFSFSAQVRNDRESQSTKDAYAWHMRTSSKRGAFPPVARQTREPSYQLKRGSRQIKL